MKESTTASAEYSVRGRITVDVTMHDYSPEDDHTTLICTGKGTSTDPLRGPITWALLVFRRGPHAGTYTGSVFPDVRGNPVPGGIRIESPHPNCQRDWEHRGGWTTYGTGKPFYPIAAGGRLRGSYKSSTGYQTTQTWSFAPAGVQTLAANPGGPYVVTRGGTLTLDGSRSRGPIESYKWVVRAGVCGLPQVPRPVTLDGKRVRVRVLCPLVAFLTVRGKGLKDGPRAVEVEVKPRQWKPTPIGFGPDPEPPNRPFQPPSANPMNRHGLDAGQGRSSCKGRVLCPHGPPSKPGNYWLPAYTLGQVKDPGGPFHRWWYVANTEIYVRMLIQYNPWLQAEAPPQTGLTINWYEFNKSKGVDVDSILEYFKQHETWGVPGVKRSGHLSALREFFETTTEGQPVDPRLRVERLIAPTKPAIRKLVHNHLSGVDWGACVYSGDPLHGLPTFRYWAYSDWEFVEDWILVEDAAVASPQTRCGPAPR